MGHNASFSTVKTELWATDDHSGSVGPLVAVIAGDGAIFAWFYFRAFSFKPICGILKITHFELKGDQLLITKVATFSALQTANNIGHVAGVWPRCQAWGQAPHLYHTPKQRYTYTY